jgi:hypothetical protein
VDAEPSPHAPAGRRVAAAVAYRHGIRCVTALRVAGDWPRFGRWCRYDGRTAFCSRPPVGVGAHRGGRRLAGRSCLVVRRADAVRGLARVLGAVAASTRARRPGGRPRRRRLRGRARRPGGGPGAVHDRLGGRGLGPVERRLGLEPNGRRRRGRGARDGRTGGRERRVRGAADGAPPPGAPPPRPPGRPASSAAPAEPDRPGAWSGLPGVARGRARRDRADQGGAGGGACPSSSRAR